MNFGILQFPGTNCDHDCYQVLTRLLSQSAKFIWHKERSLKGVDCVILPGGFSYGDYLRSGAMAANSQIMGAVKEYAAAGGLVLGICNGFQILLEAGLLPGALIRNKKLKFICREVFVRVEHQRSPFTKECRPGQVLKIPIAHHDGNYFTEPAKLSVLEEQGQILFRYCEADGSLSKESNPNGSLGAVAGITNKEGNVCGLMPHPERSSETILGSNDGRKIFESLIRFWTARNNEH